MHVSGEENPFLAIGDAAYRQCAGGGPSHGHRQQAQKKLVKITHAVQEISCRTDVDRQTDGQTHSSQYFAKNVVM